MKPAIITAIFLLSAVLGAHAATHVGSNGGTRASIHVRHAAKPRSSPSVTYNRDSKDPNIGWHWEGGMRTCHSDCDNPEIPGSGYTCKDVSAFGMAMRECDKTN